ncbi:MAG: cyclic nucleotide-binding domain-containing protein [Myxococcales bacterium]|nr:cyclic nucleotide-binding domain-containing protein [Myxococcales bacterium]
MDAFIHAANATFLASFLVRDILKLRVLSVVGGGFLLAFFFVSNPVMWSSIGWNVLFTAINGVQITRLVLERRPVRLSPEEHRLHQLALKALTPQQMRRLLAVVMFVDAEPEEILVRAGADPGRLLVVLSGALEVRVETRVVARLGPGQFVGEMTFLTSAPPKADVSASEPARLASIDAARLRALLDADAELCAAFQGVLGADVASKLRA